MPTELLLAGTNKPSITLPPPGVVAKRALTVYGVSQALRRLRLKVAVLATSPTFARREGLGKLTTLGVIVRSGVQGTKRMSFTPVTM